VRLRPIIVWACASALGHIAVFGSIFSLAEIGAFVVPEYLDGTLTLARGVYLVVLFVWLGAAASVATWYTVTLPLMKRRKNRRR